MPPYDENDMRRAEEIAKNLARDAEAKREDEAARKRAQEEDR